MTRSSVQHALARTKGVRLSLRLVEPDDAEYIFRLRSDPKYNTHLSEVTGDIDDQRAWIERYKKREAAGDEFYYVIERLSDGVACGVSRLYDIEGDRLTWGSWILDGNKPSKAALESAVLSFKLAFEELNARVALVDVRKDNGHTIAFCRRFGMDEASEDRDYVNFECRRERFERDEPRFWVLLEGAAP